MPDIGLGIFRPLYFSPDVLVRWRAGWAGGTFARASAAWHIGPDSLLRQAATDVPRIEYYDLDGDGVRETPALRLEPSRTNLLRQSSNVGPDSSTWFGATNFSSITPAASIIAGQTAWRHTNYGLVDSRNRHQGTGQFGSGPQTAYVIVENVNAAETSLSIRDDTAAVNVCIGRLSWATGETSVQDGTGAVRAEKLADAGPNGGPVYLLAVTGTGTPGNSRTIYLYPTGIGSNANTVIIHHVQLEEQPFHTSPIVTTTAPVTRAADALSFPLPASLARPVPLTIYLRFVERGAVVDDGVNRVLLQIGTGSTAPRLYVMRAAGSTAYRVQLENGASVASSLLAAAPAIGDQVELLCRLYSDGSVQIEQAVNGGTPTVAARSAAVGLPAAWSGQILRLSGIPDGANEAPAAWRDVLVVAGTDATWDEIRSYVGA